MLALLSLKSASDTFFAFCSASILFSVSAVVRECLRLLFVASGDGAGALDDVAGPTTIGDGLLHTERHKKCLIIE
jgi:hypothetical protein